MDMSGMVITARSGALTLASGDALFDFPEKCRQTDGRKYFWQSEREESVGPVPQLLQRGRKGALITTNLQIRANLERFKCMFGGKNQECLS